MWARVVPAVSDVMPAGSGPRHKVGRFQFATLTHTFVMRQAAVKNCFRPANWRGLMERKVFLIEE